VRALIEKIIRTVTVPEIVELPRPVGGTTIPHQLLIDKHFDRTKVPREVARIRIGFGEFRRRDLCIVLRRCLVTVAPKCSNKNAQLSQMAG